jgi:signal transduction histidine kinase
MAPRPEADAREAVAARVIVAGMTELMTRASHDLIGPLNRAASLLELLIRRHSQELGPDGDHVLKFLLMSSTRLEEVASGLSRYLAIASAPPQFAIVDLNECLAAARRVLEKSITESGATIETDSLPSVSADRAQMVTIFELLIGNAIRFRRADVKPHVRISCLRGGNADEIAVTDNGIGIDPAFADVIFQPFRRLNGSEYPGPGLGLTTAKLIADLHGGSIQIVGTQDKGSSVRFTLPATDWA